MSTIKARGEGRYINTYVDIETWKKITVLAAFEDVTVSDYASSRLIDMAKTLKPSWEDRAVERKKKSR